MPKLHFIDFLIACLNFSEIDIFEMIWKNKKIEFFIL